MNLFRAHRQWKERPADERFPTLSALFAATKKYAESARESSVPWNLLRVEPTPDREDIQVVGRTGQPAQLTHWAFGQLCRLVEAPSDYIRSLPPTLAVQNVNHGLAARTVEHHDAAQLLLHTNGDWLLRAITSERYSRVWNWEVAQRLMELEIWGWEPARPDADPDGAPALYASDHDMFVFLRNRQLAVNELNAPELQRGVIIENSEVGASSLRLTRFLYRMMCGNHIIWDASKVVDFTIRHVGEVREKISRFYAEVRQYASESASDEEAMIQRARGKMIAATKDEVLDKLFGMRSLNIPRKTLAAGYDAVVEDQDGDPRSQWGFVQGLTRHSQTIPFADRRTELDRAAGKILEVTF